MVTYSLTERDMRDERLFNPFGNYGSIVCGEDFIGRQEAIELIQQRVLSGGAGCLSIVGAPRIGKSSLAYQTLIYPKKLLAEKRFITLWLHLPDFKNHEELFSGLVEQTLQAFKDIGIREEDAEFIKTGSDLLDKELSWRNLQNEVRQFFTRVRRAGWKVVAVIDEFDDARNIFQDGTGFRALRQLNYKPDWRIYLVTISRRELSEITAQSEGGISIFPGIFENLFIRCFNRHELLELTSKLKQIHLHIEQSDIEFLWNKAGGHPFLSSSISFHLANAKLNSRQLDLDQAFQNSISVFLTYYEHLVKIMSENDSLNKLLQILFGPVTTANRHDADRFISYGLIKPSENAYVAFSSHFEDYLRMVERSTDYWPIWRETEKGLRALIAKRMEEKYKMGDWIVKLEQENSNPEKKSTIAKILKSCRNKQQQEQDSLGEQASRNLLDFTELSDLFEIMKMDWDLFKPILVKDLIFWEEAFSILEKVRIRMANNRDETLEEYDRQKAEGYCKQICSLIRTSRSER